MLVTPSGIIISVRLSQEANALSAIVVTVPGIVTFSRLDPAANAPKAISVTPLGILNVVSGLAIAYCTRTLPSFV